MYEVTLCTYVEDETTCMKDGWRVSDAFGVYKSKRDAEYIAANLACLYYDMVELYCDTHKCDGISFDVVDLMRSEAVTAYEVSSAGGVSEWHEEECHEYTNGWKVV